MSIAPLTVQLDITAPSCPPWCQYAEHHGYESESETDEIRYHSLAVSHLDIGDRVSVTVDVTVQESRSLTTGEVTSTEPGITVWYDLLPKCTNLALTADEAQQLAALLHRAAERLDALEMSV